jgi:mono/diheme cytochrome c family protein
MKDERPPSAVRAIEHAEPVERANPVPWLLGLVAAGLLVWGVSYFLLNPELGPQPSASAAAATSPQNGAAAVATDGTQIFASRCASCHQATGAGLPGVFPPLAGSEWVNGEPKQVARILLLGVTGKITVAGSTFNGSMPAFGTTLSDEEIAVVASHVRSSFGNKSSPITADLVKSERTALGNRTTPWAGEDELKNQH